MLQSRKNPDYSVAGVRALVFTTSAFCCSLGALVLIGWWTHQTDLIRVRPNLDPMQANTALGMLLCGISLLASLRGVRALALGCGSAAFLLGLLTLIEYLSQSSLGIDELLVRDYLATEPSHAGRMAPNTAISFVLVGASLSLMAKPKHDLQMHAAIASIGAVVALLSLASLFGSISGIDTSYWMGNLSRMAEHSSAGFLALGFTLTAIQCLALRTDIINWETNTSQLENTDRELRHQKFALDEHAIVAITDPRGVITYVNEKFCEISEYSPEELLGNTHRVINSGRHPKSFFVGMWRTIAGGSTWSGEICNRTKSGDLYWVDTTIVPFKDASGAITQYVSIRADITKLKQAEQQLMRTNAELEEYVCTASHDLKSPLLTIEGFTGFLKEFVANGQREKALECAERIGGAVIRMRANIDDLLELSRIGRVEQSPQAVELRPLLDSLISASEMQISDAEAEIIIQDDLPAVRCDPYRTEQLLSNLLSNALKYGRPASGHLRITIGARSNTSEVRLSVSDNGPGIEEQYRSKVFGLFQRLESNAESTGVGLNIVKRIAELYGGRAWAVETPGGGATFCVTLPAVASKSASQGEYESEDSDDHYAAPIALSAGRG
jgi:PAS domain S-box-containing protein